MIQTPEEIAKEILVGDACDCITLSNGELCDTHKAIAQALRAAVAEEREACRKIAESQAQDIGNELPDPHGGAWAKRFGRNVALAIAGVIRARGETERST